MLHHNWCFLLLENAHLTEIQHAIESFLKEARRGAYIFQVDPKC